MLRKKLKIQFWKPGRSLVMQILEQEGLPKLKTDGFIRVEISPAIEPYKLCLRGSYYSADDAATLYNFESSAQRDKYLENTVSLITAELFKSEGEVKIGEICEVSNRQDFSESQRKKLLAILPQDYFSRYIVQSSINSSCWEAYDYARADCAIVPTIETVGDVVTYTWSSGSSPDGWQPIHLL